MFNLIREYIESKISDISRENNFELHLCPPEKLGSLSSLELPALSLLIQSPKVEYDPNDLFSQEILTLEIFIIQKTPLAESLYIPKIRKAFRYPDYFLNKKINDTDFQKNVEYAHLFYRGFKNTYKAEGEHTFYITKIDLSIESREHLVPEEST